MSSFFQSISRSTSGKTSLHDSCRRWRMICHRSFPKNNSVPKLGYLAPAGYISGQIDTNALLPLPVTNVKRAGFE